MLEWYDWALLAVIGIVGLLALVQAWRVWQRPRMYRVHNYRRDCELCEEQTAVINEADIYVCEDCVELLP